MTILTLNKKELEKRIGKIDSKLKEKIDLFGTPIDGETEEELSVEVFPNRPDLLSMEGFSRAIHSFLNKPKMQVYKVEKPEKDYKVVVDKSVKKVRPLTACAIVRNMNFDDKKIKDMIDLQEKLHGSYGRNRRKMAIGIYPLESIKLPITYLAKKPEEIKFQPLEFPREINGRQILSQHPTGREYGHLLKDAEVFPIFQDSNNEILSMPPIINSEKTGRVSENTKDIFIECSGFHKEYLDKTLNMIVTALADMGGKIYAMDIVDSQKYLSPDLEPEKLDFSVSYLNKTLGLRLSSKEIKNLLLKMGIGCEDTKEEDKKTALIPAYRTDILHEIDLSEEAAIAYGYDKFIPEIPSISTIGEEDGSSIIRRKISELLAGLDILEISTYHISTKEGQFKKIGYKEFLDRVIELEESKTENNLLRTSLLANSIQILSENSDASYPQRLFEVGTVFENSGKEETGILEKQNLCVSLCGEKANYTEIKQILDYIARMFEISYKIKECSHPSFIEGRCGSIEIDNAEVGVIGEIQPFILKNNRIKMPVAALEISIKELVKQN